MQHKECAHFFSDHAHENYRLAMTILKSQDGSNHVHVTMFVFVWGHWPAGHIKPLDLYSILCHRLSIDHNNCFTQEAILCLLLIILEVSPFK